MTEICPACNEEFESIGQHWRYNEAHRPELSQYQEYILKGVLLGDATVETYGKPTIKVYNSNLRFLQHIDKELGMLSCGVRHAQRPEDVSPDNPQNATHQYTLHTRPNKTTSRTYRNWISENGKVPPFNEINANGTILKYWYCCDGGLSWGTNGSGKVYTTAIINVVTLSDKREEIKKMLSSVGPEPNIVENNRGELKFEYSQSKTRRFLERLGEPVPGMEYKWEDENRKRYDEMKKSARNYGNEKLARDVK